MEKNDLLTFTHKDLVTALIKDQGIHEGIWMLYLEFGLGAVNAPIQDTATAKELTPEEQLDHILPAALLPIKKVGIQRSAQLSNISVDASIVNPKPKRKTNKK